MLIFPRIGGAAHPAAYDNLGANIGLRFQQNRIHMHAGHGTGGQSLQMLRPSDLATIARDGRVIRHVLRLEGPHR